MARLGTALPMEDAEQRMKWLVDCRYISMSLTSQPSVPLAGGRTNATEIPINDCGECLIGVADHLPTYWVYSWLGFDNLPSRLLLREGVVDRLVLAKQSLPRDFDLAVIDGWRSRAFQKELFRYYEVAQQGDIKGFVSDPGPKVVPPHTTGGAVDLTLQWRGAPLGLGTDFDEFTAAAASNASWGDRGSDGIIANLRRLLSRVLREAGLAPYPLEWWHWSYGDQLWAVAYNAQAALYGETSES